MAGLWEHWMGADGSEIETSVIITTDANALVATIHPRSPVVIAPEDFETWLTGEVEDAKTLIHKAPDDFWQMQPTTIARNTPPAQPRDQMNLL
jgi:putative SOS response-associated peptidase YedK